MISASLNRCFDINNDRGFGVFICNSKARMKMVREKIRITMCPSCGCRYRTPEAFLGRKVLCKVCGLSFKIEFEPESGQKENHQVSKEGETEIDTISEEDGYLILGKLALKYKFVVEEQIQEALAIQKQERLAGNKALLGEILVTKRMMSQNQLDFLLSIQKLIETRRMDRKFGIIAVKNGFVTHEDIERALTEQKESYEKTKSIKLIGDILVESKVMNNDQFDAILKKQKRFENIDVAQDVIQPEAPETRQTFRTSIHDAYFELTESKDKLDAFFSIKRESAVPFNIQDVKDYLEIKGIKYGIVDDKLISEFLENKKALETPIKIAEGRSPDFGKDAEIKFYFDIDPLKIGTLKNGGVIDFKDRGDIQKVKKGDLLAEKIPAVEGHAGLDVYGRYLAVSKPQDKTLRKGKGTSISEDKLKIYAVTDGVPEVSAIGKIFVSPKLEISGGVGSKTGHVDFDGRLEVLGTIQSGYRVKGNSLKANEILKAEIEMIGNINVSGGIIGAKIKGGGSISAMYIHESDIEVLGDVFVLKEIIDSKINTSGKCIAKGGPILSSKVSAKKGIQAIQIGSGISKSCILNVGFDKKVKEDVEKTRAMIPLKKQEQMRYRRRLKEIENEPAIVEKVIADMVQIQDRALVKRRELLDEIERIKETGDKTRLETSEAKRFELDSEIKTREEKLGNLFTKQDKITTEISDLNQKIENSQAEIQNLKENISETVDWSNEEKGNPEVKVSDVIFADTTINGIYSTLKLDQNQKNVLIKEDIPKGADDTSELNPDQFQYGSTIRIKQL